MRRIGIFTAFSLCITLSIFAQTVKPLAPKPSAAVPPKPNATVAPKPNVPVAKPDAAVAAKPDAAADAGRQAIQAMKDAQTKRQQALDTVHEWFRRWNALDGKVDSVNKLLELYRPDAVQEVGPTERQSGGAIQYEGQRLIRRYAENFSKQWSAIHYLIANRTVKEKTMELIQTGETPWGAMQVAVEFTGGQTNSPTKKRFMLRGAAFFEFRDGKISRVRVYVPREEMMEIAGPTTVTM